MPSGPSEPDGEENVGGAGKTSFEVPDLSRSVGEEKAAGGAPDDAERAEQSRWEPRSWPRRTKARLAARRHQKLKDLARHLREAMGSYRTPIQVCPRGCSHEVARRENVTRTRASGWAQVRVRFSFETNNCSVCGSALTDHCSRCNRRIWGPMVDRCRFCGLPHPWAAERLATQGRTRPRPWRDDGLTRAPAIPLRDVPPHGEFLVIEGEITTFNVDCIVSNDDVEGRMWSAVASTIKAAAGKDVERQSVSRGPYLLGDAWQTDGGQIENTRILHVAAMDRRGQRGGIKTIRKCVSAALTLAREEELHSVALAAIGSGPEAVPMETWLQEVADEIVRYLHDPPPLVKQAPDRDPAHPVAVLLILFEQADFDKCVAQLNAAITLTEETLKEERRITE